MTNSTTLTGWLRKTNFCEFTGDDPDPVQAKIRTETAHHHATLLLEAGVKEYSQWFPGRENNVADALSRDFDRSDDELTQILRNTCPSQLPQHFHIAPLPNEISSWLTSLLQKLPVKKQLREAHMRTKLGCGDASPNTLSPLDLATTSSLTSSPDPNKTKSSEPLPWLSVRGNFQDHLMTPWLWAQSEISSRMYVRPSGRTVGPIQPRTMTSNSASFYIDSSELTRMLTPKKSNKKPSPLASSLRLPNKI
jgi:hypothetical protein